MTTLPSWLIPLIGTLLVLLIGYVAKLAADVAALKGMREGLCKDHTDKLASLGEMGRQVDRLLYRQELNDRTMVQAIHSPTHPERDRLADKLMENEITNEELLTLRRELENLTMVARGSRKLAGALVLNRVLYELHTRGLED